MVWEQNFIDFLGEDCNLVARLEKYFDVKFSLTIFRNGCAIWRGIYTTKQGARRKWLYVVNFFREGFK